MTPDWRSSYRDIISAHIYLRRADLPVARTALAWRVTLNDVSALLGRSPETVRKDLRRNPAAVPPRLVLPNTRQLRWRAKDVEVWLDAHVTASVGGSSNV